MHNYVVRIQTVVQKVLMKCMVNKIEKFPLASVKIKI